MARVSSNEYRKERASKTGGGANGVKFLKSPGEHTVTCIALAHIRSKKGRWGVAALMVVVDGPEAGAVHKHDMWTPKQVHQLIAGACEYLPDYENGLPVEGEDASFSPEPELLDEMLSIVQCADQKGKDGRWAPGVPPDKRRTPYIRLTVEPDEHNERYMRSKFVDPLRERMIGADGPYFVKNFRDVLLSVDRKAAVEWFDGRCEKQVRDAFEALRNSGGGGGGGHDDGGYGYSDDSVPF